VQLVLVRHGEPDMSAGPEDPALSALGRWQARETARYLAREPIVRIIASPLRRARETALPLGEALDIAVEELEGVAEIDRWGARYVSVEDLRADGGPAWEHFLADPIGMLGGDEPAFRRDVLATVRGLGGGGRVAVITHGLPINLLLAEALGLEGLTNFSPRHASVSRVHLGSGGRFAVLSINEATHLAPEAD